MPKTAAKPATKPAKAEAPAPDAPAKKRVLGKPVTPSHELAAIVGKHPLPRTEVVSKLWDYIRKHELQDSADKRTIMADAKLRAVLGKDRATMFELNKLLSPHLTAA